MVVWEASLNGEFLVTVKRTTPGHGVLEVHRQADKSLAHYEKVELSYDAAYGPDAFDVRDWQLRVEDALSKLAAGESYESLGAP